MPTTTTMIASSLPSLHAADVADLTFWTNAELVEFIDEAVKKLAKFAKVFVVRDTSTSTVIGTATYTLPTRHISTLQVSYNNLPVHASSSSDLEMLDRFYTLTRGTSKKWYEDKIGASPAAKKIGLYPVPDAVHTVGVIHAEYPATLTSGDTLDVPTPIADYIETCMIRDAYSKESDLAMPEVAQHLNERAKLYEQVMSSYYGDVQ